MTSLASSLALAQWLDRLTGAREVMGSIPVHDSDYFFFVPRSYDVEYSIFSHFKYWLSSYLSQLIVFRHPLNILKQ